MAARFQQFYKSQSTYTQGEIRSYLSTIQFPRLTQEQVKILDEPITAHDVAEAIAQLAKSKAPGLDGLPLEFCHILGYFSSQINSSVRVYL